MTLTIHPKGLDKKLQDWTHLGMNDKEVKVANDQLGKEKSKFPDNDVTGIVTKEGTRISTEFFHKKRPPRTTIDKIDSLIESEKKKLKNR